MKRKKVTALKRRRVEEKAVVVGRALAWVENSVPGSSLYSRACFVPIHCLSVQSHLSSGKGHAVRTTVTLAGTHSIRLIWLSVCQPRIRFAGVSTFERHTGLSGLLACRFDNSALPKAACPKPGPALSVQSRPLGLRGPPWLTWALH